MLYKHFFKLNTRMTLNFLFVNLISLVLALAIANHLIQQLIIHDFNRMASEATARLEHDMNQSLERLIEVSGPFVASSRVQNYLKHPTIPLGDISSLESDMKQFASTNHPGITGAFLMSKDGRMISMFSYYYSNSNLYSSEPWSLLPFDDRQRVIPTHYTQYPNQPRFAVISIVIPIYDTDSLTIAGRLILDITPSTIIDTFGYMELGSEGYPIVISSDDIIVYHPDSQWVGHPRQDTPLANLDLTWINDASEQRWNGEKWMISMTHSNRMGWNIVSMVPSDALQEGKKAVWNAVLLAFLVVSLLILLCVPTLTRRFVGKVNALKLMMGKVANGDFSVRAYPGGYPDEFSQLNIHFNNMTMRLEELVSEVANLRLSELRMELRQKEALIRVLQNQINPHFLYNTLGVIKSMAYLENTPRIEKIASNLAEVYRYTASFHKEEVTLSAELAILSRYLEIVELRFPSQFRMTIRVDDEHLNSLILKLTLQPIVENSVKYAVEPNRGKKTIAVTSHIQSESLVIQIADDGQGIPQKRLEELQFKLRELSIKPRIMNEEQDSMGLANVHARLVLKYGANYGISIHSYLGKGTIVSIKTPLNSLE